MAHLTERHEQLADESKWDFSDLRALFINCTLKRSPEVSNTQGLADLSIAIMRTQRRHRRRRSARSTTRSPPACTRT